MRWPSRRALPIPALAITGILLCTTFFPDSTSLLLPSSFSLPSQPEYPIEVWPAAFPAPHTMEADEWNERVLADLERCKREGSCRPNQEKVVLLASEQILGGFLGAWKGGEGVWAVSIVSSVHPSVATKLISQTKALHQLGYTFIMCKHGPKEPLKWYRRVPQIKVIIMQGAEECFENPECVKTEENPHGIPRWKSRKPQLTVHASFNYGFFRNGWTDLDERWILAAEPAFPRDNSEYTVIPYSQEAECKAIDYIPHAERPRSAWMFAKQATYLYLPDPYFAWNRSYFELSANDSRLGGMTWKGAYQINEAYFRERIVDGPLAAIPGVDNMGEIGGDAFGQQLAASRMLVGIGEPFLSPSPYLALCLGTPFLNPIIDWHADDPTDQDWWWTQHYILQDIGPPYVYNVFAHDYESFVQSIQAALKNPPPKGFIPPGHDEAAVREAVEGLVETNWEAEARKIRQREGEDTYAWAM